MRHYSHLSRNFATHRLILPRSLHLPVASTDGSLIENLNKTWVRLWTDGEGQKTLAFWSAVKEVRNGHCSDHSSKLSSRSLECIKYEI
jgi:hypothetical protein